MLLIKSVGRLAAFGLAVKIGGLAAAIVFLRAHPRWAIDRGSADRSAGGGATQYTHAASCLLAASAGARGEAHCHGVHCSQEFHAYKTVTNQYLQHSISAVTAAQVSGYSTTQFDAAHGTMSMKRRVVASPSDSRFIPIRL